MVVNPTLCKSKELAEVINQFDWRNINLLDIATLIENSGVSLPNEAGQLALAMILSADNPPTKEQTAWMLQMFSLTTKEWEEILDLFFEDNQGKIKYLITKYRYDAFCKGVTLAMNLATAGLKDIN